MGVLPLETEATNEVGISDRDRFSYLGLNSEERLPHPLVKRAGQWHEAEWPEALEAAAHGLRDVVARHGADALGFLLSAQQTIEELHLAAHLARALGTKNVDHRVRQSDFRLETAGAPWLGMAIDDVSHLQSVLLVGSTLRKEQPLFAARLRQAAKKGTAVSLVHVAAREQLTPVPARPTPRPNGPSARLAAVAAPLPDAPGKARGR